MRLRRERRRSAVGLLGDEVTAPDGADLARLLVAVSHSAAQKNRQADSIS